MSLTEIVQFVTMTIAVIPARYASTRFPGKPLTVIGDRTMIQRVYEQVRQTPGIDHIVVATDDERIVDAVQQFGGAAMMTSDHHISGTDRCAEVARHFEEATFVLNIQGDEPFIQPEQIALLADTLSTANGGIATLVKKITDPGQLTNPNVVKAVVSMRQEALYFSRHAIPYLRGVQEEDWTKNSIHYKHIGLYGFRRSTLLELAQLSASPLEKAESLEQLRWLEHGYRIKVGVTTLETIGIDTPEDLLSISGI